MGYIRLSTVQGEPGITLDPKDTIVCLCVLNLEKLANCPIFAKNCTR